MTPEEPQQPAQLTNNFAAIFVATMRTVGGLLAVSLPRLAVWRLSVLVWRWLTQFLCGAAERLQFKAYSTAGCSFASI